MPLVTVVLIFLNEERFLEEAVRSVRNQTLTDWELILVDDGSSDRSTHIARELAGQDDRILYAEHPSHANQGMAASRNFGALHGTAPYLGFIDGDDVWVPTKLAEQVDLLENMPSVAMVNGALLYWSSWDPEVDAEDRKVLTGGVADRRLDPPEIAWKIYPLGPEAGAGVDLLVRRSVFDAVGGFEERFRGMYEDQSFLMKVFLHYPIYISSKVWIFYRLHSASVSARTDTIGYLKVRGEFLRWIKQEVDLLSDSRVSAAYRRTRRRLWYKKLLAHPSDCVKQLVDRLPTSYKDKVKHVVRQAISQI